MVPLFYCNKLNNMISTQAIVSDLNDIPREWVFEHYLLLTERLCGQCIKLKSAFNTDDKVPSMCVYPDSKGLYKFKDFSSGYGGDGLNLVMYLYNLNGRGNASFRIIDDYNTYISNNTYIPIEYKPQGKYIVSDYEIRHWSTLDQTYWKAFKLSSNILEEHNVHPLSFYNMIKENEGQILDTITIKTNFIYGFFRKNGSLYKIYTPKTKDYKFIKVNDYIQGFEQLEYKSKYLVITSSLKDLMCLKKLNIKGIETIAPDSENSIIPENFIKDLSKKYKSIIVLFDNDKAGIESAKKYNSKYGFKYINLNLAKDLSDSIKDYGIEKVKEVLFPLLKELV
jgi:5S rRNA maturation endonuclease (ribonuclease M5)